MMLNRINMHCNLCLSTRCLCICSCTWFPVPCLTFDERRNLLRFVVNMQKNMQEARKILGIIPDNLCICQMYALCIIMLTCS